MKESPVAADRIVLTFRGAEHATAVHDGIKFLVPLIKNPFFGMQQTLWQRTRDDCLLTESHYQFPFTIQMPMVQFPPSMDHALYQCKFDLVEIILLNQYLILHIWSDKNRRFFISRDF